MFEEGFIPYASELKKSQILVQASVRKVGRSEFSKLLKDNSSPSKTFFDLGQYESLEPELIEELLYKGYRIEFVDLELEHRWRAEIVKVLRISW